MKTNEFLRVKLFSRGIIPGVLTVLYTLLAFAHPSFADEFTARHLGDYGNVTVMEVSGNYDAKNPDGDVNALPRQAIAKEFFRLHKDEYDFLVIFTNFSFEMPKDAVAFYQGVKNDVRGIGQQIFDNSPLYGSNGKLQGIIDMGSMDAICTDPLDPVYDFTLDTIAHEMLHRWASYVKFRDWNNNASNALIGKGGSHWSYLLDTKGSLEYGNQWRDNDDGTFTSIAIRKYYSPLDLYLMGIIDKSKIPPMLLIDNSAIDPAKMPEVGVTISGTARYVSIDDIIAVEGERIPAAKGSQKEFKMAFIYAVAPGSFKTDDLSGIEVVRNGFLTRYSILTDGKGLVQVASTPREDMPVNPGVRPPTSTPRTLPPNIDDGVKWITSRQQTDGSWTDFALTTERDTAEAVTTLQFFPAASQQFQAGLQWLESNLSANTDYLARRLETITRASGNEPSLVQELLACRNPDGGWGSSRNFVSTPVDTALVLRALALTGYANQQVIGQAIAFLQASQNSDGGWSGGDKVSAIQPTATVLSAFHSYGKSYALDTNLIRAITFLGNKQNLDGGFGNSPSTVYDTAAALLAFVDAKADKEIIDRAIAYLNGQQGDDGSWGESPFQTAMAIKALWLAKVEPDLAVSTDDMSFIPEKITALPTTAVLNAVIWNLGRTDVLQAKVALYDGGIATSQKLAEQTLAFPGMASTTATFAVPITDGNSHYFQVVVDPDGQVKESDKTNNSATKTLLPEVTFDFGVAQADLAVSQNPVDISQDVTITVRITNRGTSDAYNVQVRLFIDEPGAPYDIATAPVDIPASGSVVKEFVWKANKGGVNLPLTVQVDPFSLFTEISKENNKATIPLTVNAGLPNLSVSYKDIVVSPSPARELGNVNISALVTNDGFVSANDVKVNFYRGVPGQNDSLIGSQVIPVILPGQDVRIAFDWVGINEAGSKIVSIQVDPASTITELNKNDNFAFVEFDILSLPELAVSPGAISFNPSAPKEGDQLAINVTVQNNGAQEATNVLVEAKEGGMTIGSQIIPLIQGNSAAVASIHYATVGKQENHTVEITVDPANGIFERNKGNNHAIRSFTIQNANLWLSEPFISPDGDGVKDSTDFFFRLAAPTQVTIRVVNGKGETVRTFAGGELDSTAGTTVTWNGLNDDGTVVPDGEYQMMVMGVNNAVLGSLPVTVDTNRLPLTEAIGTRYLMQNNLTCAVPANFRTWSWLPYDSGIVFDTYYPPPEFPSGIYQMAPDGNDLRKITPDDWSDGSFDYYVDTSIRSVSPGSSHVAFAVWKRGKSTGRYVGGIWVQDLDGRGLRQLGGDLTENINDLKWSPDAKKLVFNYGYLNLGGYYAYGLRWIDVETGATGSIDEGSPYYSVLNVEWAPDDGSLAYTINTHCNADKSYCHQEYESLKVADLAGNNSVVFSSTNNFYSFSFITWLGNGMLLTEENPKFNSRRLIMFNTVTSGDPFVVATQEEYPSNSPNYAINPDSNSIAFITQQGNRPNYTQTAKLIDLRGNITTVGDLGIQIPGNCEGPCTSVPQPLWSQDGNKFAYVEAELREDENKIYENIVVYDRTTAAFQKQTVAIYDPPIFDNYSGNGSTRKVNRLIAWLEDKLSILLDMTDGFYAINTATGVKSSMLPIERGWDDPRVNLSPGQRYITYYQATDPYTTCAKQWGQDIWAISSLLNLTADLRVVKEKSALALKGTAADRNFGGYRLEYADIQNPTIWEPVMPPSDRSVVNDLFTTWIPPHEGTYYVRLTVWDQAGNQTVTKKRVSWGLASSITGLYLSTEIFSPNGDGNKDIVDLNYRVLEPVHLEFTVRDVEGNVIRTFTKDHAEAALDSISWDGRNESGVVVPDGKYTIRVFDYEFSVELDATPPDAAITRSWPAGTDPFNVFAHAYDVNLKRWIIEYGEGENPEEWHEFQKGQEPLLQFDQLGKPILRPKIADKYLPGAVLKESHWFPEDILWIVGKRLRLTAEDFAGNITSRMTDLSEERLVFQGWRFLDKKELGMDDDLRPGLHEVFGFESIRGELTSVGIQYRMKGVWYDTIASLRNPSGKITMGWNTPEHNKAIDAVRLVATGVNGMEYLSNELPVFPDNQSSDGAIRCPTVFGVAHGRAECGMISGKAEFGVYPPVDALSCEVPTIGSVSFFIEKDGASRLYSEYSAGRSTEIDRNNTQSDSIDTRNMPEGQYQLKAIIKFSTVSPPSEGYPMKQEYSKTLVVDRILPSAKLTLPAQGSRICPIAFGTEERLMAIPVEGVAADNINVKDYSLWYGIGDNPKEWYAAMTRLGPHIHFPGQSVQIGDHGPNDGHLGYWDVNLLLGKTVTLKHSVTDVAGNTSCTTTSFSIRAPVEIQSFSTDKTIFASNRDTLSISYTVSDESLLTAKVFRENGSVAAVLFSDRQHSGGSDKIVWDGRGPTGEAVPDGKYMLVLYVKDPCGFNVFQEIWVEIDNSPPETTITYPKSTDPLPPGNIFEVKGTASDPHFNNYALEVGEGTAPSAWMRLALNRNPVKDGILGTWNTYGLQGIWTLRLRAEDTVGNSNSTTSTIDLGVRKTLVKNFEAAPKLFSPNGDQKLDTTLITGEVTDACQLKFEILDGSSNVLTIYATATVAAGVASFNWDGRTDKGLPVADGVYSVRLTAALTARPEVTQTETITLTVDNTLPAIAINDPPDKAYLNRTDVPLTGSVTDPNLVEYAISVTGPAGMAVLDSGIQNRTNYAFGRMTDLSEETYTVNVDAKDQAENSAKLTRLFTIDRTPPKVTLETPRTGEYFGNSKSVIDITGAIVEKNLARYSLRYGAGESPTEWKEVTVGETLPAAPQLFAWKVGQNEGIADGVYTLSLYVKDKAGLEGEAKVKLVVDNTPPGVAITSLRDGDYVTKAVDVKGTLTDANLDKGTLELSEGQCVTAFKWAQLKSLNGSITDGVLETWKILPADGDYCLRLSAVDKSGNKAETKLSVKIDTHPPAAPALTGKTETKTNNILTWSRNSEPDLAGYNIYRDGTKINAALLTDTTLLDAGVKEGAYTYVVKAVDIAGNESDPSNSVKLRIDLTGPTVRISSPLDGARVTNLLDIKGTAFSTDDFKEYRVFVGQGSSPSAWNLLRRSPVPISFGQLAQWDTIGLPEGSLFFIKLEGEDLAGNVSVCQVAVTVDNLPPAVPVLLTASLNSSDASLTWRANTEPDLGGYLLYRNDQLANVTGLVVGNLKPYLVAGTTYLDKGVPDGTYRYYLAAMDQAGNTSDQSNTLSVTIDTRPPHATITDPVSVMKFEKRLLIRAETPDNDIASIQFQFKRPQDSAWNNLGASLSKAPSIVYLDPQELALIHGDYQLQALATDLGGKTDPAPSPITVTYTDLTPPAVPLGLAGKTTGADVNLTWSDNSEADLDGYHVYRWVDAELKSRITPAPLKEAKYLDAGLADATYGYEITAIDRFGNESRPSNQVQARVYAPILVQPFTPTGQSSIRIDGENAEPNGQVEIFAETVGGLEARRMSTADAAGRFKADTIPLSPGENRLTARITDSAGNISRLAEQRVVVYNEAPAMPTGLAAAINAYDANLSWTSNTEADLLGYYVYRDGVKLNATSQVAAGQASASSTDYNSPQMAVDGDLWSYWLSSYAYGTFTPTWWQFDLPAPELLSHLEINWYSIQYAAKDFEVQGWSGYAWITLAHVTGNIQEKSVFDFSPPYRTDRLRVNITATNDQNYSKQVGIAELALLKENALPSPSYQDPGLKDGKYHYRVSAVDIYGFESPLSEPATAAVGDVTPPAAPLSLSATADKSDVLLDWSLSPNREPDLAGYNLYRQTPAGWLKLNAVLVTGTSYVDAALPNDMYVYHITAVDQVGNESAPSPDASATVAIAVPLPPIALHVVPVSTGKALTATWQAAAGAPAGYNLYRGITPGGPYTKVNGKLLTSLTYLDAGLLNGTSYYYVIVAVDGVGNESVRSIETVGVPVDTVAPETVLFLPTISSVSITLFTDTTTIVGSTEPAAQVELLRNDTFAGKATALAHDIVEHQTLDRPISWGAISPDGTMLAYVDYNDYYIWLKKIATGETTLLLQEEGDTLRWSPDGKRIAYTYWDSEIYDYRIGIYDLASASSSRLTNDATAYEDYPSWSPDGKKILFVSGRDGYMDLWLMELDNRTMTQVTVGRDASLPQFSPGGDKISFVDDQEFYILDVGHNSTTKIGENPYWRSITWSPDGRRLAYGTNVQSGDSSVLHVIDTETAVEVWTQSSSEYLYQNVWTADGQRIILGSYNDATGWYSLWLDDFMGNGRLLQGDMDNLGFLDRHRSGAVIYSDSTSLISQRLEGTFTVENVTLEPGANIFTAYAIDEAGNAGPSSDALTVLYDTGLLPDLAVTSEEVSLFPVAPHVGEEILAHVVVRNLKNTVARNVPVDIYLWDATGSLNRLDSFIIPSIAGSGEETVAVRFAAGTRAGGATLIVVVDPQDAIKEAVETNNYATREFYVTDTEGVAMTTTIDGAELAVNQDETIRVTLRNSGMGKDGTLEVAIEDAAGNRVKAFEPLSLRLQYGVTLSQHFDWNSGATFAGVYKVHCVFRDATGTLADNVVPFEILPELQVNTTVTTDKVAYLPNEPVALTMAVRNDGRNLLVPELMIMVKIADPSGLTVLSEEKTIRNSLPGMVSTLASAWNTGLAAPGDYRVDVQIYYEEKLISSSMTHFTIKQVQVISGTITAEPAVVQLGRDFKVSFNLTNRGNVSSMGTAVVQIIDPDTRNVFASADCPIVLAMNGSQPGEAGFSSQGLGMKSYIMSLAYEDLLGRKQLSTTQVMVKDGLPPVVTVMSPIEGVAYNTPIDITVLAIDGASGVEKVEYQKDGGAWTLLPFIDPIKGKSGTIWTPTVADNGTHTISFRGTDRVGNTSTPVSVAFTVRFDTTPPVLQVSTLSDGSYTRNETLNVAGMVTDDGGVKEVIINGVVVAVNADGSFSHALVLANGSNIVTVDATDLAGNRTTDTRTIYLDQSAPFLAVITPADNSKTGKSFVEVTGTVDENATVKFKVKDVVQYASMNGLSFSATVMLESSLNTIDITADDLAGNSSSQKRTVLYDDGKPALSVAEPPQDIRTDQSSMTIKGTVTDALTAVGVTITMDEETYQPSVINGAFEQLVLFPAEKTYTVIVTATDEVGNSVDVQRNIIYAESKVAPFNFTPQTGAALNTTVDSNTITVTGINAPVPIAVTAGEYSVSIDGGTTWSAYSTTVPASVTNNAMVKLRQTSAATFSTTTTATLMIGGVSGAFSVTTIAGNKITVTGSGVNGGTITGNGLNAAYNGSSVTGITSVSVAQGGSYLLTAVSTATDVTVSWSGDCSSITGNGTVTAVCTISNIAADRNVTATFTRAIQNYRVYGNGYITPETAAYRASMNFDVTGPANQSGWLKYAYSKTRMSFASTAVTSVSVSGRTASITGTGTVNGAAGYSFNATVTDGAPDSFAITIRRSDGTVYYSAAPNNAAGGDLVITP